MSLSNSLEPYEYYKNNERVNKHRKIQDFLKKIRLSETSCLKSTDNEKTYLLGKSILLGKQIGSKSKYGVVYKCKNVNPKIKDIPLFTIKVQLNTNALNREVKLLSQLSNFGLINQVPNLPILYKVIKCPQNPELKLLETVNKNTTKNGYTMILNELASGDLYSFLGKKYTYQLTDELWRNLYEQLFMSLAILHALGISHNDAHGGNFLYHKIKKGGCFHYKINGTNYYIKNLGFLWTSWDYGKVSQLKNKGFYVYDYMLLNLITRKNDYRKINYHYTTHEWYNNKPWGYLNPNAQVPPSIERFQDELWEQLGGYHRNNDIYMMENKKMSENKFLKYFLDKGLLFSKKPIGKVLSSVNINFK